MTAASILKLYVWLIAVDLFYVLINLKNKSESNQLIRWKVKYIYSLYDVSC